jgi:hypothetical protein
MNVMAEDLLKKFGEHLRAAQFFIFATATVGFL